MGWRSDAPVTVQEKVEMVHELVQDDEAAAAEVATDFLRRRTSLSRSCGDTTVRAMVNEAQFEQSALMENDEFEDVFDADEEGNDAAGKPFEAPATIIRGFRRSVGFTDLLAVCGFVAGGCRAGAEDAWA